MKGNKQGIMFLYHINNPLEESKIHSFEQKRSKIRNIQEKQVKKNAINVFFIKLNPQSSRNVVYYNVL